MMSSGAEVAPGFSEVSAQFCLGHRLFCVSHRESSCLCTKGYFIANLREDNSIKIIKVMCLYDFTSVDTETLVSGVEIENAV